MRRAVMTWRLIMYLMIVYNAIDAAKQALVRSDDEAESTPICEVK